MQLRHWKGLFDGVNFGSLFDLLGDFYGHLLALFAGLDGLVVKLHGSNSVRELLFSTPYFYLTPNFESLVQLNHCHAKPIGKVVHWYDKLGVAVVKLNKALKVGSQVKVRRGEQEFTDNVTSMQLDHKSVKAGKKGEEVAIKVSQQVKEGAEIYAIK